MTTALASPPPLTSADRCDRCRAQAYVRVTMASGSQLLFCAHHGRVYESKLREVSVDIQDDRARLTDTPATAALEER